MATLSFNNMDYTVDHAVKGTDYIHGYDAAGLAIVCFDGITDFSLFTYDGEYMAPGDCAEEASNDVKYCGGQLQTRGGTAINFTAEDVNARPDTWTPIIMFVNTPVATTTFVDDTTSEAFPYRAAVALTGVTAAMIPDVMLAEADALSGKYSPVAASYDGGVYIYASEVPAEAITIPSIILHNTEVI